MAGGGEGDGDGDDKGGVGKTATGSCSEELLGEAAMGGGVLGGREVVGGVGVVGVAGSGGRSTSRSGGVAELEAGSSNAAVSTLAP